MFDPTYFNTQIAPLLQLLFSAANAFAIVALFIQIRQTTKWNRLSSSYNFLSAPLFMDLEENLRKAGKLVDIDFVNRIPNGPLSPDEINVIIHNGEISFHVHWFLNELENACISMNLEIISEELFYTVHGGRIAWWFPVFKGYVETAREVFSQPDMWSNFYSIGVKLSTRRVQ